VRNSARNMRRVGHSRTRKVQSGGVESPLKNPFWLRAVEIRQLGVVKSRRIRRSACDLTPSSDVYRLALADEAMSHPAAEITRNLESFGGLRLEMRNRRETENQASRLRKDTDEVARVLIDGLFANAKRDCSVRSLEMTLDQFLPHQGSKNGRHSIIEIRSRENLSGNPLAVLFRPEVGLSWRAGLIRSRCKTALRDWCEIPKPASSFPATPSHSSADDWGRNLPIHRWHAESKRFVFPRGTGSAEHRPLLKSGRVETWIGSLPPPRE
jgi:hypothetical protein